MNARTKIRLLSAALTVALACNAHAESRLIDLNTGTFFDGIVSTKPLCTVSQDADGITVSYQFDYAIITNDDDETVYSWNAEGLTPCTNPGEPAIMATRDIFNITDLRNVNVDITGSSYIDLPYELSPTPYPTTSSFNTPDAEPIQPYTGFFPNEIIRVSDSYNVRDGRYVDVDLCAIQYNYSTKTIRAYKSVTYRITPKNGEVMQQRSVNFSFEPQWLDEGMESIVSNPQSNTAYLTESTSADLGLLIVTSKELKAITEEYAKYKRSLGLRTHVITLENGGNTPFDDVKSLIQTQLAADKSISYLLIVGDTNHVPAKIDSIRNPRPDTIIDHVTDLYYVAADRDTKTIPTPSIKYGRIPLDSTSDIQTVFDKIKKYELMPPSNNSFYNNVLYVSHFSRVCDGKEYKGNRAEEKLLSDAIYEDYKFKFVETTNKLYQNVEDLYGKNSILRYGIQRTYSNDSTDVPHFDNYTLPAPQYYSDNKTLLPEEQRTINFYNKPDVIDILNAPDGVSLFYYNAHGNVNCMIAEWTLSTSLNRLTNADRLPVVLGVACHLGAYNKDVAVFDTTNTPVENFTRAFLRQKNGGCVGIISSTNLSWVDVNNIFCKYFVRINDYIRHV